MSGPPFDPIETAPPPVNFKEYLGDGAYVDVGCYESEFRGSTERSMKPNEAQTLRVLKSYGLVTRGWWWRGFYWGWGLGSLVTCLLFWLAGNLA